MHVGYNQRRKVQMANTRIVIKSRAESTFDYRLQKPVWSSEQDGNSKLSGVENNNWGDVDKTAVGWQHGMPVDLDSYNACGLPHEADGFNIPSESAPVGKV